MKKRRLDLNDREAAILRYALAKIANQIEEDMKPWTQFGEDPPELLQERLAEITDLWDKLLSL